MLILENLTNINIYLNINLEFTSVSSLSQAKSN